MAESGAMSDSKKTERSDADDVCKKSINNDETLSALSAISAAAAECMSSLKGFDSSSALASPSTASVPVARLERAKQLDMLYNKMSISKMGMVEQSGKDASSAIPPSPPALPSSPPPRPEADARLTK